MTAETCDNLIWLTRTFELFRHFHPGTIREKSYRFVPQFKGYELALVQSIQRTDVEIFGTFPSLLSAKSPYWLSVSHSLGILYCHRFCRSILLFLCDRPAETVLRDRWRDPKNRSESPLIGEVRC